ncbi:predicted protein [Histoplasma mississippiense (nom. inval.)]|uniref:predicted protein n=1 Tax=Ajellomyces capsulatus (strain NAm1 / WU24) TaxID=2059318 RepID=UPI000157D061|nr:predicted protein [Histoplasma mississippiense (nom. inval.)]EDN04247.1 predicted protein [Histoplasma mississippiense (nom. inval.)]
MASHTKDALELPEDPKADDWIEIIWEKDTPTPKIRITSYAMVTAIARIGRVASPLTKQHSPGPIYHDFLNALQGTSCDQSFAAAIWKVREALDRELDLLKTNFGPEILQVESEIGWHYWTEVIYRRFLGTYKLHHVRKSVLPAAEDSEIIEATLAGICPSMWGLLLRFASSDENFYVAVTFKEIQHLHRRGVTFLENYQSTKSQSDDTRSHAGPRRIGYRNLRKDENVTCAEVTSVFLTKKVETWFRMALYSARANYLRYQVISQLHPQASEFRAVLNFNEGNEYGWNKTG